MSKERLQEIKRLLEYQQVPKKDIKWLISQIDGLGEGMQVLIKLYQESVSEVERLQAEKENFLKEFNYEYGWQIQNAKNSKSEWHKGALRGFEHSKEIFDRHFQALKAKEKGNYERT
jgi:hypothetical protein